MPLLAASLEVTGVTQQLGLTVGITPFFSSIGIIAVVWSLPRFHLQKVIPVARQTVFEHIGDCVVVLNMQNRVVDLNPAAEHLAGYTISEALGLPVEQIWPNWLNQFVPNGPASKACVELVMPHAGEQKTYDLHTYTITDDNNRPLNQVVLLIDITERKKAEETLRISENKYRTLFEKATEGILIADIETKKFKYANPAICTMLGYGQEELAKMSVADIHPKTSLEHVIAEFSAQARGERASASSIPCLKKDGTLIYVDILTAKAAIDGSECNIGFFNNVTGRKQAEEDRQRSVKLESVGTLAGGIAHDFNNILTGILGNIQLANLYLKQNKADTAQEMLAEAEKASLRARGLTQQLLTFSKGGLPVKKAMLINKLIKEYAIFALRGSNIKPEFAIPDNIWAVEADEGQLIQVISNLVINADQAMPNGGIINITASNVVLRKQHALPLPEGNYIEIAVEDQGIGIPEGYKDRIFDPYFTTKQKGSGLGLATSYSIIKNHGGHITFESKFGAGTTFRVYLPATTETVKQEKGK
jgi:PAS domain S-box-containing protein